MKDYISQTGRLVSVSMQEHLNRVRPKHKDGSGFGEHNGRPSKQREIEEWFEANPSGTVYRCAKETCIDRNTIRKWKK